MGSTCWILLKSWKKEYSFSKFHDRYFYLVVVAMVQCLCWCCYFYHLDSFYFCFFLCKAFLRNEILNCFQSANDDNNSKAFFLFFGTPSLLFRVTIASTMVFLFYIAIFFSLSFHLQSTEWRTFTLSLPLYVDFIIIQSFGNQKKMKN